MSCVSFLTDRQRAALRRSKASGPLSRFASPPQTEAKLRRLRLMALDPDQRIRESAALAAHAPADVLRALSNDGAASVRRCVARNPMTPSEVLATLAADDDEQVRGWVAANPACSAEVLSQLAADSAETVRRVVTWARAWQ